MKTTIIKHSLCVLSLTLLFVSCSKSKSSDPGPTKTDDTTTKPPDTTAIVYSATEDFSNGNGHSNTVGISFTGVLGDWTNINEHIGTYSGGTYDSSFLDANTKYLYLFDSDDQSTYGSGIAPNFDLKGLKKISVTFGGSALTGETGIFNVAPVAAFNAATDSIGAGIKFLFSNFSNGDPYYFTHARYNQTGKLFTLTMDFPTKADLMKLGMLAADADAVIAEPQKSLLFSNLSTKRSVPASGDHGAYLTTGPIVITKIIFGFTQKPTWAK